MHLRHKHGRELAGASEQKSSEAWRWYLAIRVWFSPGSTTGFWRLGGIGEGEGTGYSKRAALFRGPSLAAPGSGSALPARRAPAAATRGLCPSCSRGLSVLIYYSPRLDCLIEEMCSSLH